MDFETLKKVKFDGDEYEALRALARVTVFDDLKYAGVNDEGLRSVYDSLTQRQLATLWDIIKLELQSSPEMMAEFIKFHEEKEKRNEISQNYTIKVTNQDLIDAKEDHKKAQVGKSILKLIISGAGLLALTGIMQGVNVAQNPDMISLFLYGLTTVFNVYFSVELGKNIKNYFENKKRQKQIEEDNKYEQKYR